MEGQDKMVKVTVEIEDCEDCPYYTSMITKGFKSTYGSCDKIDGQFNNEYLMRFCPFKENEKEEDDDVEWKYENGKLYGKSKDSTQWYKIETTNPFVRIEKIKEEESSDDETLKKIYCQECGTENNYLFQHCSECGARLRKSYDDEKNVSDDWWEIFKDNTKYYCKRCENYMPLIQCCWECEDIEYDDCDKEKKSPYKKGCENFKSKPLRFELFRDIGGNFEWGLLFWFVICTSPLLLTVVLMLVVLIGMV